MFYILIIILANLLIAGFWDLFEPGRGWFYLLISMGATVTVIALDGLEAFLIRRLPERWFRAGVPLFQVKERERKFLRRLGIRRWKRFVPELGGFTGFHKDRVRDPKDPVYLARFLLESNYGVAIHLVNAFSGYLLVLFPWCGGPGIALPVAAVNMVLNLLPTALLRYNTLPLWHLYRKQRGKTF